MVLSAESFRVARSCKIQRLASTSALVAPDRENSPAAGADPPQHACDGG